ncbi:hypothetical protein ACHAXS_002003 [Conticribra weissflogii]
MLDHITGYNFFTKLDISMQTIHLSLVIPAKMSVSLLHNLASKSTNSSPWDLNANLNSPSKLRRRYLQNDIGVYLHDIGAFSLTWEHHILLLENTISVKSNGFTVNLVQCEWTIQETIWFGYWHMPMDLNCGIIKLMVSCKYKNLKPFPKCVDFLVLSFITTLYVASMHTHPCISLHEVCKENILFDRKNGPCIKMLESTYGT